MGKNCVRWLVLSAAPSHISRMSLLPALPMVSLDAEIHQLARDHARANGPLMALLNRLGGGLEGQIDRLPASLRQEIEKITLNALTAAHAAAGQIARAPDMGRKGDLAAAMASGALGGSGGLISSVAELPVTITLILHAIRREARAAGFDPELASIRAACLEVFSSGTPLSDDDGVNAAFISTRLTMTGPALQKLIATVAPRLAAAMGQKLAAQAVPVLGAVSGAALNAAYLRYFRELARIRFALMRLSIAYGAAPVLAAFAEATSAPRITKA